MVEYTNGILGNQEMYRIELHLNECELCSDAVDGLEQANNVEAAINKINATILPKQRNTFMPNYMTIAASVALIAVIGISYWFITKPAFNETIAINTPAELIEESLPVEETSVDSEIEQPTEESIVLSESEENDINSAANEIAQSVKDNSTKRTSAEKQKSIIRSKESKPNVPTVAVQEEDVSSDSNDGQPEGNLSESNNTDIGLSEVVQAAPSTARASKKNSANGSIKLKDQKEPSPIGGLAGLKNYISKNLNYPQQAIDNNIKGTVVLNISINSDGSLNSIVVAKGLGFGCDAEAMRLISSGPKWTPQVENGIAIKGNKQIKVKFKKQ